jgi:hypothetical protein
MKKLLFVIIPLALCFPLLVKGQMASNIDAKCLDYACNIDKAKAALNSKLFKEAIDYCRAAKAAPNANIAEADATIYKILETIVAQKNSVEAEKQNALIAQKRAIDEEKKAKEAIKMAETELGVAKRDKESAETIIARANSDEKKALEAIKKAENDIEVAKRAIDKARLDISNAIIDREKAKASVGYANTLERKATDGQKKADADAEAAKRDKDKNAEIIAYAERTTLASANLIKDVSDALTGSPKREEIGQTVSNNTSANTNVSSADLPVKKENTQGGIYIQGGKSGDNTAPKPTEKNQNTRLEMLKLQKAVDAEKDKQKAYVLQGQLVETLEKWYQKDTTFRNDLAESYANKAWSALFLKRFTESEQACYKGLAIDPSKRFFNAIMGHSLLFQENFDAAMRMYLDYTRDARQFKNKSNRDAIIEDLEVLKQEGMSHKNMAKVKATLLEARR